MSPRGKKAPGKSNSPAFKMERVRGELPPDPNPPKRGKGRSPAYRDKLQGAVDHHNKTAIGGDRAPWYLIAEHSERRGSEAVLRKFERGDIEVPRGTVWQFETREGPGGKGQLFGRLLEVLDEVEADDRG